MARRLRLSQVKELIRYAPTLPHSRLHRPGCHDHCDAVRGDADDCAHPLGREVWARCWTIERAAAAWFRVNSAAGSRLVPLRLQTARQSVAGTRACRVETRLGPCLRWGARERRHECRRGRLRVRATTA